ncbi:TauD/TfdA dioxygenase family protein [Ferrovibrio sp.]|uniref:TauD/TfdA dioxygenase family protein n=1 Tax=Ferrovibrio sp. TaxID=1917215 RepID=UPI003D2B3784
MDIKPIAAGLGAEVTGIDLAQPLDAATVKALRQAWLKYLVLLFRGQTMTPQQLIDFSARFAPLETHESYQPELRHPDHPELLVVKASEVGGRRIVFGQQWHSDLSYTTRPSLGSCLYCRKLPSVGGDTLFANMYMAYDELSPAMQRLLERLEVVHDLSNGRSLRNASHEAREGARRRNPPVAQPAVRVHPETGRKALYISEWMCPRFVGMSEEESAGLLRFLFDHSVQEPFTMRQRWRVDDVLMWDNRATIHMALADYAIGEPRELLRTSMMGEDCGRLLQEAAE